KLFLILNLFLRDNVSNEVGNLTIFIIFWSGNGLLNERTLFKACPYFIKFNPETVKFDLEVHPTLMVKKSIRIKSTGIPSSVSGHTSNLEEGFRSLCMIVHVATSNAITTDNNFTLLAWCS